MDAEVCPIAIKYNKIFVDAFWSEQRSRPAEQSSTGNTRTATLGAHTQRVAFVCLCAPCRNSKAQVRGHTYLRLCLSLLDPGCALLMSPSMSVCARVCACCVASCVQSFQGHLATLMCSWAVVCEVYYLDPQRIQPGENGIAFSNRVKRMIADKAGLRNVSYDGYLKHFEVKQSLVQRQQKMYADVLSKRLTSDEKAQIAAEEINEEQARLKDAAEVTAHELDVSRSVASPSSSSSSSSSSPSVLSGPDSLSLSPSPDALALHSGTSNADCSGSSGSSGLGLGLASISSTTNLIELINAKQEEERTQQSQEQQIRQRK